MTPISLPSHRVLIVDVPDWAETFELYRVNNESIMLAWHSKKWPLRIHNVICVEKYTGDMKDYGLKILGVGFAKDVTEEEAAGVVEWYEDSDDSSHDPQYNVTTRFKVFMNYETGDQGELDTALESLFSLIKSDGHQPERSIVLVEKIKLKT